MKFKRICICEYCGKESESKDEIKLCEAKHLNLTVDENHDYYDMKCNVDFMRRVVEDDNSTANKTLLESVVNELIEFEAAHNVPDRYRYK